MEINKRALEHFPVQLFAVIMGVSSLAIVFAKAYHLIDMKLMSWSYLTILMLRTL